MNRFTLIAVVVLLCSLSLNAQQKNLYHPFSGSVGLSVEGLGTITMNDYSSYIPDYGARASLDYYFPMYSNTVVGLHSALSSAYLHSRKPKLVSTPALPYEVRTNVTSVEGGLTFGVLIDESVMPYFTVGGSYAKIDPRDINNDIMPNFAKKSYRAPEYQYLAELGLKILLTNNLSINFGGSAHLSKRDYLDDIKTGIGNDMYLQGFAGITYTLFNSVDSDGDGVPDGRDACAQTPSGIAVDLIGCPVDSDKDGVPDYLDQCPKTPEGVKVNAKGCPIDSDNDGVPDYLDLCPGTPQGIAVDENGCPKDADGDTVPDYLDKCLNTPKGAQVDSTGCPLDSDGDGVPDYDDKCPNTPKGVQVDSAGCPLTKEQVQVIKEIQVPVIKEVQVPVIREVQVDRQIVLSGTSFQQGKSILLAAAFTELDKVVALMKQNVDSKWIIEGHTDNKGTVEGNKKISLARAQAVVKYFVSKGLDKSRFTVRGMGAEYPITTNASEEGRNQNRRIVIFRVN